MPLENAFPYAASFSSITLPFRPFRTNICFEFSRQLTQLSISHSVSKRILDFKKGYYKTLKNIPAVSEDLLKIAWKGMKIALIIPITQFYMKTSDSSFSNFTVK